MGRWKFGTIYSMQIIKKAKRAIALAVLIVLALLAAWVWWERCGGVSHAEIRDAIREESESVRQEARRGRDALIAGDLAAFGQCMIRNAEAQASLHSSLVNDTARRIFDIAKRHGAIGWKVNGAGGDGGSVTILSGEDKRARADMVEEINAMGNGVREIGIRMDNGGLRVMRG